MTLRADFAVMRSLFRCLCPSRVAGRLALTVFLLGSSAAHAEAIVLDNDRIRFGTGSESSVNSNGNLQQPFYYDSSWFPLTYSDFALDNAIGIGGDGTNEWNVNGTVEENAALAGQIIDSTGYTSSGLNKGYGTIISTGTVTIDGKSLEFKNTYELPADKSFIKITTRVTNTSGGAVQNVRVWVGTRDDYVGNTDQPTKQRGNLANGTFTAISTAATRAAALKIYSGETGVLFYSTSDKAHTAINWCCSFSDAYNQDPATAAIEETGDGSYALFVRMNDLASGASEEFTWYYAAGAVASLDDIVEEVADESGGSVTVSATASSGGSIAPSSVDIASGATTTFTVSSNTGYEIDTVQGCDGSLSGTTFTTGAVSSACTVNATFVLKTYAVTASAGAGGTISPAHATIDHGATSSFTVTPASGYSIQNVAGCGGTLSGSTYTTGVVTNACSVTATFTLNSYQVSTIAGTGGTITPSSVSVAHGTSTSFTVVPNAGRSIASVQGCGGALSGSTYTTDTLTDTCTVSASFTLNAYALTASASSGGKIAPKARQVTYGSSTTFEITPESGYSIVSVSGCNGSLSGTTYTTAAVTGVCAVTASFAATAPRFEPAQPAMLELNASELFTQLPSRSVPKAYAFDGSELQVSIEGGTTRYVPGEHLLTWQARDARGVVASVQQVLRIWPLVSFGPDLTIGAQAGNSASFRIALNGRSPVYPFTVSYTADGALAGHDLQGGQVTFQTGEVEKEIHFAVLSSVPAGSADQQVQLKLQEDINRSTQPLTVTFTALNKAPSINLSISQGGKAQASVSRDQGSIEIKTHIFDPNTNDTHTSQWIGPAGAAFTQTAEGIAIDPSSLPAGVHRFELTVTDDGVPPVVSRSTFELVVHDTMPVLPSGAAGWLPNGLPNHPDYAPVAPNVLPERTGELQHYIMESEPGTQLALGSYAMLRNRYQTELSGQLTGANLSADSVGNVGGYFDFVISALPKAGQSVSVVIPQRAPIPAQPVYRKFDNASGRWNTFVEDIDNLLASAPGEEGFCPPPASETFRAGLNPGDWCVRLTIQDGGPNDTDKERNGSVSDPGGVGTLSQVSVTGDSKRGGGAGSLGSTMLLAILALALLRVRAAKPVVFAALVGLSVNASADETKWYAGAAIGEAHSDVSERGLTQQLIDLGYAASAEVSNQSRLGWRVHAGYQASPHLGFELGYVDLGELETRFFGVVADTAEFLADTNALHPASGSGVDVAAIGRIAIGSRLTLHARTGVFVWEADIHTRSGASQYAKRESDGLDLLLGIGGDIQLFSQLSFSATATRYKMDGEYVDLLGAGLLWRWR